MFSKDDTVSVYASLKSSLQVFCLVISYIYLAHCDAHDFTMFASFHTQFGFMIHPCMQSVLFSTEEKVVGCLVVIFSNISFFGS